MKAIVGRKGWEEYRFGGIIGGSHNVDQQGILWCTCRIVKRVVSLAFKGDIAVRLIGPD